MLIIGPSTNDKLRLQTGSVGSIRPFVSWIMVDGATPPVVQDTDSTTLPAITTATTTDILVGTASRKTRVGYASFFNDHASVTNLVTAIITDGANPSQTVGATLAPGESLVYTGTSWVHYDANGVPVVANAKLDAKVYVASDVSNNTTSFADVTGLSVPIKAGRNYAFEAVLHHQTAVTTTGSRFGVNGPAAPTMFIVSGVSHETPGIAASNIGAGTAVAYDTAIAASTTGPGTTNAPAVLHGFIKPSVDGVLTIRFQSEIASSALTVKAGSWLRVWEQDS